MSLLRLVVAVALVLGVACAAPQRAPSSQPKASPTTSSAFTSLSTTSSSLQFSGHLDVALRWRLRICGAAPSSIGPVDPRAAAYVVDDAVVDGCRVIVMDLRAAAAAIADRDVVSVAGDDVVSASPDLWLWTTSPPRAGALTITHDDGVDVAVPFPQGNDGAFDVDDSTWRWLSSATFGRFDRLGVEVGELFLDVVVLPGTLAMSHADIERWLRRAGETVQRGARDRPLTGRVVVVVAPVGGDDVPFGMVKRGGGSQLLLLLGREALLHDVIDQWVAIHELSHLLAPPLRLDEAWLSEGIATYHQTVLRARSGALSTTAAWRALLDGFDRGREASGAMPLDEASRRMRADGRWLQVYQGGAAVALLLDVELRRCGSSLDAVLASLRATSPPGHRLAAADVVARAAAQPGCGAVGARVEAATKQSYPAVDDVLVALGVGDDGASAAAPDADVRDAIMR